MANDCAKLGPAEAEAEAAAGAWMAAKRGHVARCIYLKKQDPAEASRAAQKGGPHSQQLGLPRHSTWSTPGTQPKPAADPGNKGGVDHAVGQRVCRGAGVALELSTAMQAVLFLLAYTKRGVQVLPCMRPLLRAPWQWPVQCCRWRLHSGMEWQDDGDAAKRVRKSCCAEHSPASRSSQLGSAVTGLACMLCPAD